MLCHRLRPRVVRASMLGGVGVRVGVVVREVDQGWWAREDLKAERVLIVRGMPLKEMHLRPISRRSSAVERGVKVRAMVGTRECRTRREARELRVIVAAACVSRVSGARGKGGGGG